MFIATHSDIFSALAIRLFLLSLELISFILDFPLLSILSFELSTNFKEFDFIRNPYIEILFANIKLTVMESIVTRPELLLERATGNT